MKNPSLSQAKKLWLTLMAVGLFAVYPVSAATVYWVGTNGVSATTNWSDTANWLAINTTTPTTPANNEANFNWNTMASAPGLVTVNVDGGYGTPGTGTPQAWGMFFTQTNGFQTVFVQPGITLALQAANGTTGGGNLAIDPGSTNNGGSSQGNSPSIAYTNYTTFTGIGGTFFANTATMRIEGQSSIVGPHYTVWDMSGLGTYVFTNTSAASQNFYCSDSQTRSHVLIYLAHTNIITLSGGQMHIGNLSSTSSNSLPIGMYLGMTNYILTGTSSSNLLIGGMGCSNGFLQFNPAFVGGPTMPSAYISGTGGSQNAAICSPIGGSYPGVATANFNGGNVTWVGTTLDIGVSGVNVGVSNITANGTLMFDNGLVNFNTVLVGSQPISGGAAATGTIDIGTNAVLKVNTKLTLGAAAGTVNPATSGTINVSPNGTLQASVITNGGAGSAINLTNANWNLSLSSTSVTNMIVSNFNALGSTNLINITAITPFLGGSLPLRFHLISTVSPANLAGAATLGVTLPVSYNPSYPYAGYLDYTTTPGLVDFVLTAAPPSARPLVWSGTNGGGGTNILGGPDGDWDVATTMDWLVSNVATVYNQYDLATFNDVGSAAQTNINLATTITPYSVTVSNNVSLYTFGGGGNLSGSTGLTKLGTGTLVLDNGTPNNFTGGVTISGGILQVGANDTSGNLPAGTIVDNGVLAFGRTDNISLGNVISGTGAVVSGGGGTLELAGANSFTGVALATNGSTLQGGVSGAFGASSGTIVVANGSTLDPNGLGTARAISVSGNGVGGNGAIVNSGGVISDSSGGLTPTLTLLGNTTLSYPTRWDLGSSTGAVLTNSGLGSSLTLNGTGNNTYFEWRDLKTDPTLANINIVAGYLGIAGSTTVGNSNSSLNITGGAGLKFYSDDGFNVSISKQVILNDDGLIQNGSGANIMNGGLNITNSGGSQYCQFEIGGTSLTINSTLTGNGILYMQGGTNLLTLNGNGSAFIGGVYLPNGNGSLALNGTLGSGITNEANTVLSGSGTVNGVVDEGGAFYPGGAGTVGTFTTAGLVLESGAALTMDLRSTTAVGGTNNDLIVVNGDLTANGNTILINPLSGTLASGTYTLMTYTGALNGGFAGAQMVASSRYTLTLNTVSGTPNAVQLVVSGNPNSLVWNNGAANGQWDVQNSFNWSNLTTHVEDQFYTSDSVTFDDSISTAANPATSINVGVNVSPSIITNNSTANNYTFSGPGAISGGASIVKTGSSTLTIKTTNSFAGNVTIAGGTLLTGGNASLGNGSGTVFVTNGATLDLGYSLGAQPLVISGSGVGGAGALVNSVGSPVYDNPIGLLNIKLAGNTTIGGSIRIDFGQISPGSGVVSSGGSNYSLTVVGTTYREWDNVTFDTNFGNINVMTTNGGTVGIKGLTTLGNPANTLAVFSNAIVDLYEDAASLANVTVNKNILLYGGSTFDNAGGLNLIVSPITLGVASGDNCALVIGGTSLTVSNAIGGPGNLVKTGASPLILAGTNTYTGNTVITTGPLDLVGSGSIYDSATISLAGGQIIDVSGRTDKTLDVAAGQTLEGSGTVNGSLVALSGSTLSPGLNGTGTLTVTNAVNLQGTTVMGVGAGSNNLLSGLSMSYGGTLELSFAPGSLASGNSFKLFNSTAASYSGQFASISPATPGPGLQWNTSLLDTSGTLSVAGAPVAATFGPASLSGQNLTLTWTGGTPSGTWHVLASTNVALPLTNWAQIAAGTNNASGGGSFTNVVNTNDPAQFYILEEP